MTAALMVEGCEARLLTHDTMIGPLAYIGGKRRLARRLIDLFPDHTTYVEPFCGGAQVFFAKKPSRVEVLNDLDGNVLSFLRVCQHHPDELVRSLKYLLASRRLFEAFQRQDPETLTDVQRAVRFLYLQKNSFGGKVVEQQQNYHYCVSKPPNYNPTRIAATIEAAHARLARVQLESWPYERILERFDRPSTLFYLDPPYVGVKLYRFNLADEDFRVLAERLARLRGRFLLSINDRAIARQAFRRFEHRELTVSYTATPGASTVTELVFANFPLPSVARHERRKAA